MNRLLRNKMLSRGISSQQMKELYNAHKANPDNKQAKKDYIECNAELAYQRDIHKAIKNKENFDMKDM